MIVLFFLSKPFGALADRYPPRVFVAGGSFLAGAGILLLLRTDGDADFLGVVLPSVLLEGLGLAMVVAPLTATVVAAAGAHLPMQDDVIRYEGQPVAIVLAHTLEAAEYGASLVLVEIETAPFIPHPGADPIGATAPRESPYSWSPTQTAMGDADAAGAAAPVVHEAVYLQPSRRHNPIEPSATPAR